MEPPGSCLRWNPFAGENAYGVRGWRQDEPTGFFSRSFPGSPAIKHSRGQVEFDSLAPASCLSPYISARRVKPLWH